MTCHHCGARVDNGLALCSLCQRKAQTILEYLPIYFRNLARWRRPARPNGSSGSSNQWLLRRGDAGDADRIGAVLDQAGNALETWGRCLTDDRALEPPTADDEATQAAAFCSWFQEHLTTIATLDWCGEFVRDLDHHEERLRGLTETAVPGWYAGACRHCQARTYVVPGLTWVTCRGCGSTTYARDHLDIVLDEARDWIAPPKRIAEAIVALVDTEQSVPKLHKRISKWGERWPKGGVQPIRKLDSDGDEVGPKRYNLGAVLDVLLVDGATRIDDVSVDTVTS